MLRRSIAVIALGLAALAGAGREAAAGDADAASCLRALDREGVSYRRVSRRGIDIAVEVRGELGGVEYRSYNRDPLVLDCSLVYSLARAGRGLRARGIERVSYSSAYQRRNIRGTSRPSRHSFGLAIDLHTFALAGGETLAAVRADYEQGLGDASDCVGEPLTELGALLRAIECELIQSGLFRVLLTPDYDPDHYNHFHVEALPWPEREDPRDDPG
ncbi:MAG TPA: extensin family protein [Kofleriaceae bacterium]|nr:extensin family protein [Kofleriaceae bacterium]